MSTLNAIFARQAIHVDLVRSILSNRRGFEIINKGSCSPARIAFVSVVRDDIDVLDTWLKHHRAIGSRTGHLIVSHQSSPQALRALSDFSRHHDNIVLGRFSNPGFHQAAVMYYAATLARRLWDDPILVPLDADEFLSATVVRRLQTGEATGARLAWRHAIPRELDRPHFTADTVLRISPDVSSWEKVAIKASQISLRRTWTQGNHGLSDAFLAWDRSQLPRFEMLHVPFRGPRQLAAKVTAGKNSVDKVREMPSLTNSWVGGGHWQKLALSGRRHLNLALVMAQYGESSDPEGWAASTLRNYAG